MSGATSPSARRARLGTTGVFLVHGAATGSWIAQIPFVADRFGLADATLGLLLLTLPLGVVLAFPPAGQAIARHGSRHVMAIVGAAFCLAPLAVLLMPHPLLTGLALVLMGLLSATVDIAMNAHGVAVEARGRKPIMSSLHAGWAFGGLAGAGLAAIGAAAGLDPRVVVAGTAALLLAGLACAVRAAGAGIHGEGDAAPAFALPGRGVLVLAVLCLLIMVAEGAMGDWGGVYLRRELDAAPGLAALAYSCFAGGMTAGRLVGDAVNARIGPLLLVRGGAVVAIVPLLVMLAVGSPALALVCLVLVGLGLANGVPLLFSAAGRRAGGSPGHDIAAVSSLGSLGFVIGPPLIGGIAHGTSLPWALACLALAGVAVLGLARRAVG